MPRGIYPRIKKINRKPLTEEHKDKIRRALTGRTRPEEARRKQSEAMKGNVPWNKGIKTGSLSEETKRKMAEGQKKRKTNGMKGKTHTEEWKKQHSERVKGANHPGWLGGISFEPYSTDWTEVLRESIRIRDSRICQLCSKTEEENGRKLDVHHIDYDKKNCDPNNLITLCKSCNLKVNTNREYWMSYFQNFLKAIRP